MIIFKIILGKPDTYKIHIYLSKCHKCHSLRSVFCLYFLKFLHKEMGSSKCTYSSNFVTKSLRYQGEVLIVVNPWFGEGGVKRLSRLTQ